VSLGRHIVREQGTASVPAYRQRVARRGDGEVEVAARLRATDSERILAEQHLTAQLKGHETAEVAIELQPATEGPFREEVEVTYPP
jgi:hypothetical protein